MASPLSLSTLLFFFIFHIFHTTASAASLARLDDATSGFHLMTATVDGPESAATSAFNVDDSDEFEIGNTGDELEIHGRRSLYWRRFYYISYGALSANRIPCPPRSGRSYYTHNCFRARGPVRPYYRGCSCITRCRR